MNLELKLKKRGWSRAEIDKTMRTIHRGEHKKSLFSKFLERMIFWLALFICLVGNFFISMMLIPMLLLIKGNFFYFILIIVGFTVGILFELIVCSLENMEKKKYVISGIFVPFLSLINIFLISQLSNNFSSLMHVSAGYHDPLIVSLIYVISFMIPYFVHKINLFKNSMVHRLHAIP